MHGNAHSKANRPYRTTISEAQIGLQKRYPNPASSFQLNLKRYISGNVKPKSGFKKRARKCFEKPPKKRCISRVRYTFKLPSMAKLSASKYQICASGAHADALMHLKPFQVEPPCYFSNILQPLFIITKHTRRRFPPTQVAPRISIVSMPRIGLT